jgi:hypothetical protein
MLGLDRRFLRSEPCRKYQRSEQAPRRCDGYFAFHGFLLAAVLSGLRQAHRLTASALTLVFIAKENLPERVPGAPCKRGHKYVIFRSQVDLLYRE